VKFSRITNASYKKSAGHSSIFAKKRKIGAGFIEER
jgi:hypothetical protein